MNPRALPPAMAGNNADTKSKRFLVIGNDGVLTPKQNAETEHAFFLHQQNVRTALGGFLSRDLKLSDGSRVRIVSNSGQHAVTVWPIPVPTGSTPLEDLFMAVPSRASILAVKPSGYWKYKGDSTPPTTLKPSRKVATDEPTIFQHPGNLTWFSADLLVKGKPLTLSWYGRATRYGRFDYYGKCFQHVNGSNEYEWMYGTHPATYRTQWYNAFKPAVWMNGVKRDIYKLVADVVTPVKVVSAGMKKIGDDLYVYVLSFDTKLAVYRGLVSDPYSPNDVEVELDYTTTFEVDNSGSATTHWETLLQPLYFNKSCTKLAGLVSVKTGSTVNADAALALPGALGTVYRSVLMEVDLEAPSTAYTLAHASYARTIITDSHTGVMSGSEARNVEYTDVYTEYSAVDYKADQLVIAVSEVTYDVRLVSSGSWASGAHNRLMNKYVTGSYQIVRTHDSAVLASLAGSERNTGTFYAEATDTGPDGGGFPTSSGSGYRTETFSGDIIRAASVEGGDLRHDFIVVGEIVETGSTEFSDTIAQQAGDVDAWHPGHRDDSIPNDFGGMSRTAGVTAFARQDALRFAVWRNNALVDSTATVSGFGVSNRSLFGLLENILTTPPEADTFATMQFLHWNALYPADTTNRVVLGDFLARTAFVPEGTPHFSCGLPFVNVSAANNAGDVFFYGIESGWQGGLSPSPVDPHTAFIIDDVLTPVDEKTFYTTNPTGMVALSAPVFIDNVPLKESQL